MNIIKILMVMACLIISFSAEAKKPIKVEGEWKTRGRSIIPEHPVEAWLDDNGKDLSLKFKKNLGLVTITVTTNSGEIVYKECINTAINTSICTTFTDTAEGEYTLSITDNRNILYGEFSNY